MCTFHKNRTCEIKQLDMNWQVKTTNKMCCVSVDSEEQTDLNYTFILINRLY